MRLNGRIIQTTANRWERLPDGGYRCGNVEIHLAEDLHPAANGRTSWFVYERMRGGELELRIPEGRPWGYGHPGQAKIGAALMARARRHPKKQQPRATPGRGSMGPS